VSEPAKHNNSFFQGLHWLVDTDTHTHTHTHTNHKSPLRVS